MPDAHARTAPWRKYYQTHGSAYRQYAAYWRAYGQQWWTNYPWPAGSAHQGTGHRSGHQQTNGRSGGPLFLSYRTGCAPVGWTCNCQVGNPGNRTKCKQCKRDQPDNTYHRAYTEHKKAVQADAHGPERAWANKQTKTEEGLRQQIAELQKLQSSNTTTSKGTGATTTDTPTDRASCTEKGKPR